jgi:rubrerythrin
VVVLLFIIDDTRRILIMTEQQKAMAKALNTALKMEKDGMAFYKKASNQTKNPLGKEMFLSFVEDEKGHYTMIESIANGLSIDKELMKKDPAERVKTIFEEARKDMDTRLGSDPTDVEALKFALNMEKEGYKFYKESAASAQDPKEKELFERLAHDESQHQEILENALSYLEETGDWFLWEEGGPIEG